MGAPGPIFNRIWLKKSTGSPPPTPSPLFLPAPVLPLPSHPRHLRYGATTAAAAHQHEEVALLHLDTDPSVLAVANVKVSAAIGDVANLFVLVQMPACTRGRALRVCVGASLTQYCGVAVKEYDSLLKERLDLLLIVWELVLGACNLENQCASGK